MGKMLRVGRISVVFAEKSTATVLFEDINVVSPELQILNRGAQGNKDYWLPTVGEQVLCAFPSSNSKVGFILGTSFNDEDKPPVIEKNKRHFQFEDGTFIEYDSKSKVVTINTTGQVNIIAGGNVHVTGDVIANGVSLTNHTHNGVHGVTSPPNGG